MRRKQQKKFLRMVDGAVQTYINTKINAVSEKNLVKYEKAFNDFENCKLNIMSDENRRTKQIVMKTLYINKNGVLSYAY